MKTPIKILDTATPNEFHEGQEVSLKIAAKTELGYKAVVNGTHWGVLYYSDVFKQLEIGQELSGYIKKIREDYRLDLSIYKTGHQGAEGVDEQILLALVAAGGFLALTDKSPPEQIYDLFGVSKKKFKIALGSLYKKRKIRIEEAGVYLVTSSPLLRK